MVYVCFLSNWNILDGGGMSREMKVGRRKVKDTRSKIEEMGSLESRSHKSREMQ